MNSLIVRTVARWIALIHIALGLYFFWRGHNAPGGGFIGGLIAGGSLVLLSLAYGTSIARRALLVHPMRWIGAGLLIGATSGLLGVLDGKSYFTGTWTTIPGIDLFVGSPVMFDLGVFLVVIGVAATLLLNFMKRDEKVNES